MCKPKVSVNWEEAKLYFLHPTEEQNLLPPRQRQFPVAMLQWPQTICHASRPVGRDNYACLDSFGKIERNRVLNVFIIKIILFESVCLINFCVFHISFGARSYVKIVRLFNLPTGKKNSGLTPGAVVTHQTWMLFLASSMRENVWKKDRSSQVQIPSTLVVYLVFSADQNGQFDRFERFCVPLAICYPVSAAL